MIQIKMMLKLALSNIMVYFTTLKCLYRHRGKTVFIPLSCKIAQDTRLEGFNRLGRRTSFSGNLGLGTYVGEGCRLNADIGRYCSISDDVRSISGIHPTTKFVSTSPAFYSMQKSTLIKHTNKQRFDEYKKINGFDVVIGHDVCISAGVKLLGGIEVGNGAIIGAGAVVTKNIPAYSIVAGVPAKIIGYRFEEDQVKFLQTIKWWNKSDVWIRDNAHLFDDVCILINEIEN